MRRADRSKCRPSSRSPPLRTSMICSPSSSACTIAAHSFKAGAERGRWRDLRGGAHAGQDTDVHSERRRERVEELVSEGLRLSAHFARPPGVTRVPALLVLPGFPRGAGGAAALGNTDATLCDRVAREAGWAGLTFTFRGTGPSEGDFSIDGWLADVRAAVDVLDARRGRDGRVDRRLPPRRHARDRHRRRATIGCAASRRSPRRRHCARGCANPSGSSSTRGRTGVLRSAGYPADPDAWIRAIANLDPVDAAASCRAPTVAPRSRQRRRRRPGRGRPAPGRRGRRRASSCASSRTVRTACATTPARSPRSSAGSTTRNA